MKKKGVDIKFETYQTANYILSDLYIKKTDKKILYWACILDVVTGVTTTIYGSNMGKPIFRTGKSANLTTFNASVREVISNGYKGICQDINKGNLHHPPYAPDIQPDAFKLLIDSILLNNRDIALMDTHKETVLPMKAYLLKDARIEFPCFAQFKLNGFRCRYIKQKKKQLDLFDTANMYENVPTSKEGSSYNMSNISKQVEAKYADLELDGEFYIHGMPLADIEAIVTSDNHPNKDKMNYYVFDLAIADMMQDERFDILDKTDLIEMGCLEDSIDNYNPEGNIVRVKTIIVNSIEEAMAFFDDAIFMDYEGIILRNKKGIYEFGKRSRNLAKIKQVDEDEFTIKGFKKSDKDGTTITAILFDEVNNVEFDATLRGAKEKAGFYYDNKDLYIGKQANVEYRGRTKYKKPSHAIVTEIDNIILK